MNIGMYKEVYKMAVLDDMGISVADARRRLPQLLRKAEDGEEIRISRRGKPVAVLLSVDEYERLRRRRPSVRAALASFRERIEGDGGVDLDVPRDPSPGREIDL